MIVGCSRPAPYVLCSSVPSSAGCRLQMAWKALPADCSWVQKLSSCACAPAKPARQRRQGNPQRSCTRQEDKPTGQVAGRARTPLWAQLVVVWPCIHSTAPAPRCCQCRRAAWRGTVCPAPLPLGTAARYWALAPTARSCERAAAAAASRDLLGRGAAAPFPLPKTGTNSYPLRCRGLSFPHPLPPFLFRRCGYSLTEAACAVLRYACGGAPPRYARCRRRPA